MTFENELKKSRVRYPKKYTYKEWMRFPWHVQELLCRKYDVTLTEHTNPVPLKLRLWNMFEPKNINHSIDTFQKYMDKMDDMFEKWDEIKNTNLFGEKKDLSGLVGNKRDYSALIGK